MITAVFGPSALNAIIAIGIFNMPVFARLTRGAALSLWTRDFVWPPASPARARRASRSSTSCPTSPTS
jgi:peptide/nickel transport system permease protein